MNLEQIVPAIKQGKIDVYAMLNSFVTYLQNETPLKRKFIGIEIDQDTFNIAKNQIYANRTSAVSSPSAVATAYPFLKWAGGKRQLLPKLSALAPKKIERYFEPFLGAGALFFHLMSEGKIKSAAYISDISPEFINAYTTVRDDCKALTDLLLQHKIEYEKAPDEYYCKLRDEYNFKNYNGTQRAAQLITLNKTCYNGLYRVNLRGIFNVAIGRYHNPPIWGRDNLLNVSKVLSNSNPKVTISVCDYSKILENTKAGDFIYFDPPYYKESKTAHFTSYTPDKFFKRDHIRLAEVFKQLHEMKCNVMLTNSNTPLVKELYSTFADFTKETESNRSINCKDSKRKTKGHMDLIIRNYN
jgi:DNA adenine methylase